MVGMNTSGMYGSKILTLRMELWGVTSVRGWLYNEEKCKVNWAVWKQRRKPKVFLQDEARVFWEGKTLHYTNNAESSTQQKF